MASILYRKLDASGDPLRGGGSTNFVSDLQAVTQAILTRLKLFQGEWWESLTEGTPMFGPILGSNNGRRPEVISLLIQQRILGTPFVTGISNVQTAYDPATRQFSYSCLVSTQFGILTITSRPGSKATILNT